ncbi:acylneuraminate cytidylyltransferase family protein [Flavilitoribacter nigricans]|uniref:Acylneuraminate cytidylyltransferase n=1 Tax=Flavilitoribacter nigricans (strain ATCC 23147 / DSM 23189 / NBRC 102662 / NCIMB 1420 / SS-2) TaxID=1122177 RepID=A0A2D0NJC9_FLAN2|nr:acylneuraminate cytidylyltransferase family protein [Flavilitoribacter nigricans]PHN08602.1 acylneuraminate cytidylyltransferase [Flavilitoribacter nigricans DSM 23189 = NBRC 102662]
MKVLGLIPARGGSKGIPRKNLKALAGKPLVCYTIEAALQSSLLDTVIVSTEDAEIAAVSRRTGAEVPFLRPAELAADSAPTIDTVVHALQFYESRGKTFDAICLLQPTTPFRTAEDIDLAIRQFKDREADCLISVRPVPHQYNPHWIFEPEGDGYLRLATGEEQIIPRRQELPPAYYRDGAIYLTRWAILRDERTLYGKKITYCVLEQSPEINIDTPADWANAERLINQRIA